MDVAEHISFDIFFKKEAVEPFFYEQIVQVLLEGEKIPSFPASLRKLQEVVNKNNVTIDEISSTISLDVGLSAKFIRLANSPVYRGVDDLTSVYDALLRIGLGEVRSVAMAAGMVTEFRKLPIEIDWIKFWTHNLLVAKLTERICDIYKPLEGGEYLAGLLHDVGKLVLLQHFPGEFERILEEANKSGRAMFEVENEFLGLNHAQIGAAICGIWNLHPRIRDAILYHHNPEEMNGGCFLARCVHVADSLATLCNLNIHKSKECLNIDDINHIPAWTKLKEIPPRQTVYVPLLAEYSKAQTTAEVFLLS